MGPTKVDPVTYARLIVFRCLTGELCRKRTPQRRDAPSQGAPVGQQPRSLHEQLPAKEFAVPRNLLVVMVWVLLAVVFVYWYLFVR